MALDYFEVECREESGRLAYKDIAADVLQDLDLIKVVSKLYIRIDLDFPFFFAAGVLRKMPPPVKISDFAGVMVRDGNIVLDITDERYMAQMLTVLWERYGRDRVIQPDRFTVTIDSSIADAKEIEDTVVFDQRRSIYKDLLYALQWIAPEGFRVRREWVDDHRFWYVSSENTLSPQAIDGIISEKMAMLAADGEDGGAFA